MDDRDLHRLAEIGIDVYLPRGASPAPRANLVHEPVAVAPAPTAAPGGGVLLLADATNPRGAALLAGVVRALAFARVDCAQAGNADEATLATARALVAFGDVQARAAGAALSAQRQREIGWVVTAEPAVLAGDARAKRALWSELKRVVRPLRPAPRQAGRAAGDER